MKGFMKRFYRELICLVCLVILFEVVRLWVRYDGVKNPQIGSMLILAAGADLAILVRTFRRLWREKIRRAMVNAAQRVFEKAVRRLAGVLEKMGFGRKRSNVIGGRTSILFDSIAAERELRKPTVRRLRWKQLPDSRARLGYLYRHMIKKRIEAGSVYYSSDTPLQLRSREENTPIEDELFALYIEKRYDARTEPDEDTLLRIKDEMQIK